jgi:plasmid stabilization system protein ParE
MNAAAAYYEDQQKNLGRRFLASVQDALNRIRVNPLMYRQVEPGVRRCLVRTFPFGVLFRTENEQLVVVAVMHLHREPEYWNQRT